MNAEQSIFNEALGMTSAQERQQYLHGACGDDVALRARVEALLVAHEQAGAFLDRPAIGLSAAQVAATLPLPERPGTMIGSYKLLEQIGEGGMGVVFMAEQQHPVRRHVALKIIKPGLDTKQVIARFDAERQALAMMDHSNIARVLDAGATETGRPYFVMELVKGVPITEYCDQHQLNPRQRLELFMQVCQAVQHAHTKGIIHRDLKPTNVLITHNDGEKPVPKVIDFGIAKATAGQRLTEQTLFTHFQQMIGTPLYMSPEQAEMSAVIDVDTRSDVYSLGVLLYELLTGTTPFDKHRLAKAAYEEVRRIIREEEPPRPSTRISTLGQTLANVSAQRRTEPKRLGQMIRGELDWIVMRALEKDRARRYETADGLARDVERYLEDQPVEACPPSRLYRLRKLTRRNRAAVAAVAAVLFVLTAATAVSVFLAVRATRAEQQAAAQRDRALAAERAADAERDTAVAERRRADEQAAVARAVLKFQNDMFINADPAHAKGPDLTVVEVMRNAAKQLDAGAVREQPHVEAAVRRVIGFTLHTLGQEADAESQLRKAIDLFRQAPPTDGLELGHALVLLAEVLEVQGKHDESDALLDEGVAIARRHTATGGIGPAVVLGSAGQVLIERRRPQDAEPLFQQAYEIARGRDADLEMWMAYNLATLAKEKGDGAEAERLFREVIASLRAGDKDHELDVARILGRLSSIVGDRGDVGQQEALNREALDIIRRRLPKEHREFAFGLNNVARALMGQGKFAEALPLAQELADWTDHAPAAPRQAAYFKTLYPICLARLHRWEEAEAPLRAAHEGFESLKIRDHEHAPQMVSLLSELCDATGRPGEAAAWRAKLADIGAATSPATRPSTQPSPSGGQ